MKNMKCLSLLAAAVMTSSAWAHSVAYPHAHPHVEQSPLMDIAISIGLVGLVGFGVWVFAKRVVAKSK